MQAGALLGNRSPINCGSSGNCFVEMAGETPASCRRRRIRRPASPPSVSRSARPAVERSCAGRCRSGWTRRSYGCVISGGRRCRRCRQSQGPRRRLRRPVRRLDRQAGGVNPDVWMGADAHRWPPRPHPDRPGADRQPAAPSARWRSMRREASVVRTSANRVHIPTGPAPSGNRPGNGTAPPAAPAPKPTPSTRPGGIRVRIATGPAPSGNRPGIAPARGGFGNPVSAIAVHAAATRRQYAPAASASASRPARRRSAPDRAPYRW